MQLFIYLEYKKFNELIQIFLFSITEATWGTGCRVPQWIWLFTGTLGYHDSYLSKKMEKKKLCLAQVFRQSRLENYGKP